jgi:hypothetical protein
MSEERRGWNDLDSKTQTSLLSLMPKSVRQRVRNGDMPTETEVEELIRKHYDLGLVMFLWKVSISDVMDRELCRHTVKDAFLAARHSLEQQLGPQVRAWTDLQVMTMNVPPPNGYRWEIETRRVAPKTN